MRITLKRLRMLIGEAPWRASAPARLNLPSIEIDAEDSREAGEAASLAYRDHHGVPGIDPFSIDVEEIQGTSHTHKEVDDSDWIDAYNSTASMYGLVTWEEFIEDYYERGQVDDMEDFQGYWLSNDPNNIDVALIKGVIFASWLDAHVLQTLPPDTYIFSPAEGWMTPTDVIDHYGLL